MEKLGVPFLSDEEIRLVKAGVVPPRLGGLSLSELTAIIAAQLERTRPTLGADGSESGI